MKSQNFTLPLMIILIILIGSQSRAEVINVSVAASMTDAFKKMAKTFKPAHPDITIQYNFGSSGSLAKQVAQGAPADIYVSANTKWMDYLVEKNMIQPLSVRVFARNSLVFVGRTEKPAPSIVDLLGLSRIAIGSPASVPAGQYAEQAMRASGIYDTLLSKKKLIMAKDVRQALLYADRGDADGAFVYKTDALLAEHAVIMFTVPQNLFTQVSYPLALTHVGKDKAQAKTVYDFINSREAMTIFESFGFTAP